MMVDYLTRTPIVFFLFALSLAFCLWQLRILNSVRERD